MVLFAHGSGSSRKSPRNRFVAEQFQRVGIATLLLDLLTPEEERADATVGVHRFDIPLLAVRLGEVTDLVARRPETRYMRLGYFGAPGRRPSSRPPSDRVWCPRWCRAAGAPTSPTRTSSG
jgi:putative phosphoribosyl transferase